MEQACLLGVRINRISLHQMVLEFSNIIEKSDKVIVSNVNIHALNIAYATPWFKNFLNQSHLTFCDGVGVKLASRFTGQVLYYRFTPPDFIENLCENAVCNNWKIFFLGAKPGVAQIAADKLLCKYPDLQIATYHGYFDKTAHGTENNKVIKQINQYKPQILIVGFGMPLQEKWILENFDMLDTNIFFPAGALFDYISGQVLRAPRWVTDHGFEWLGRLLVEPRRLWKRYLMGNPLFFWRVFVHHILGFPLPD